MQSPDPSVAAESDLVRFVVPPPSPQFQRLARGLRHDLGTILTPIVAFGELLGDDAKLDEQSHGDVNAINKAAARGSELIEKFLTAAGLTSVEHTQMSLLDLAEILEESWAAPSVRARAILAVGRGAKHSPEQADLITVADRSLMGKFIKEVSLNAATAGAGTALISVGIDSEMVIVRVADDGPGPSPDVIEALAEPYFSTGHLESKGLGLSVVNGIANALGGTMVLEVDKTVGGFTVELSWPAAGVDDEIVIPEHLLATATISEDDMLGEAVVA